MARIGDVLIRRDAIIVLLLLMAEEEEWEEKGVSPPILKDAKVL